MLLYYRIICTINEIVMFGLVFYNVEFAPDVILKPVLISVQVVFCDICQYGDIRPECFYIIQLKAADFRYIPFLRILCNLFCNGNTDISDQRTIQSTMLTDVINHGSSRRFSIAARDAQNPASSLVAISQFNFTDNRNAPVTN